ncbi:MAG: hypothetical protein ABW321_36100, partial [Polyangiales bacterium]
MVWELLREEKIIVSNYDAGGTDAQWHEYIALMGTFKAEEPWRFLVYAEQAPPRFAIEGIAAIARGKRWLVSLLSGSLATRFVATTFSLVMTHFRFFPHDALPNALDHLGCTPAEKVKLRQVLR